ncbi:MAG: hypothetical protein KIT60_25280 [Burkholderiaceae bacterium]|nr:hypothetical protein [Burkholderiaceae bacterium]
MKMPCLAPNLVAVTLMAAAWPAQADVFHSLPEGVGTVVIHAKPLSSNLALVFDPVCLVPKDQNTDRDAATVSRRRVDPRAGASGAAPMLGARPGIPQLASAMQTMFDPERAQLRDGIARARLMPQVSIGTGRRF